MDTKLLYVVVSSPQDCFLEQAYISMCSAKKHEPFTRISVLTDNRSAEYFYEARQRMIEFADEVVIVDFPDGVDAKTRSRLLKTSARQHIVGDYLYVDTDTIITSSLSDIDECEFDIAAVKDLNGDIPFTRKDYFERQLKRVYGESFDIANTYYNSGVMYVKDTVRTHEFYEMWNYNYRKCSDHGISTDQLSLVYSNYKLGELIMPMRFAWNTMLKVCTLSQIREAKIMHYFNDGSSLSKLNNPSFFSELKETGQLNCEIRQIIEEPIKLFANDPVILEAEYRNFLQLSYMSVMYGLYKRNKLLFLETIFNGFFRIYNRLRSIKNK